MGVISRVVKRYNEKPGALCLFLSFFLPFLIMAVCFALHKVYPFGDRQILVVDFWHQYYPFLDDLTGRLREGSSLMWSWTSGAGTNYLALISYYAASPLNLLLLLFPQALLREGVTLILLLKIGFAGLFFAMYLRYALRRCDLSLPVFSLFYALCAFTLGYYWNIMWMDVFALLGLVMLGLHSLVREGRWRLYVIALALSVFINYYIGLFTCIYTFLMFVILCITEGLSFREFIGRLLRIGLCTLVALGLTAILTVPAFLSLQRTYSAENNFPSTFVFYESFIDIIGNFIAFTPPTTTTGLPNLYCGLLSVMLLGPFLRARKIALVNKLLYTALTAFLIISCNINVLNFIWHGLHFPNMLPYRFSFLISFTAIVMAYHAYTALECNHAHRCGLRRGRNHTHRRDVIWDTVAMFVSGAVFIVCAAFGPQEMKYVLASAVLGAAYLIFFALRMYAVSYFADKSGAAENPETVSEMETAGEKTAVGKPKANVKLESINKQRGKSKLQTIRKIVISRNIPALILLVIVIAETGVMSYIGVETVRTTERNSYPDKYEDVQELLAMREGDDAGFYRTELTQWYTTNAPAAYGYEGVSIFSSTINKSTTRYMLGLGLYAGLAGNRYLYARTSPLTDAFLNVRYLVNRRGEIIDDTVYMKRVGSSGSSTLLENNYYLPFGFMTDSRLAEYKSDSNDPIVSQNDLFARATGLQGDLFLKLDTYSEDFKGFEVSRTDLGRYSYRLSEDSTTGTLRCDYEMPRDGVLFIYTNISGAENAEIFRGEESLFKKSTAYPSLFLAGRFCEGEIVSVLTDEIDKKSGTARVNAAIIDHELFEQGYDILSKDTLELTEFTDTRVRGVVNVSQDGLLYTSLPYEKGWRAFVDGTEREIVLIDGSMAALQLDEGEHSIEFRYVTDGLIPGLVISVMAILGFALMLFCDKLRRRTEADMESDEPSDLCLEDMEIIKDKGDSK